MAGILSRSCLSLGLLTTLILGSLAESSDAQTIRRTVRRTLHQGGSARIVKLRNLFSRMRHVRLVHAPDRRVVRADLINWRGDPAIRLRPVGAPRGRRIGYGTVGVGGYKWNFNSKRWQPFVVRVNVTVHAPRNAPRPRRVQAVVLQRQVRLAVGSTKRTHLSRFVGAPVRRASLVSSGGAFEARLQRGGLSVRGARGGRGQFVVGGEYYHRRSRTWRPFRVVARVAVHRR